jgi:hypothetical protein
MYPREEYGYLPRNKGTFTLTAMMSTGMIKAPFLRTPLPFSLQQSLPTTTPRHIYISYYLSIDVAYYAEKIPVIWQFVMRVYSDHIANLLISFR